MATESICCGIQKKLPGSMEKNSPGVIILDANVLKYLEDSTARAKLTRELELLHLSIWPSALNVIEAVSTRNARVRSRMLETLASLAAENYVLPLMSDLLADVGRCLLTARDGFESGPSKCEWMIFKSDRITDATVAEASRILKQYQQPWTEAHQRARKPIRELLHRNGLRNPWLTIPRFLDEQWMVPEHIESYVARMWTHLKLPGTAPVDRLLSNHVWKLYFEALGSTVYERIVLDQPPKPAGVVDLIQLAYLGVTQRGYYVTEDTSALRVGAAVVSGRYVGREVLSRTEFFSLHRIA